MKVRQSLPPLDELIESGKVLALNMPAGTNPALARAIGVMLKNAWLQSLLRRPAKMKDDPGRYFRPAVFICDEYQSFASVARRIPPATRNPSPSPGNAVCIPIVATQSISSLRSVLGSSEAWRTLLQTLRTRIFLSLSDDAAPKPPLLFAARSPRSNLPTPSPSRPSKARFPLLSAQAGGGRGSVGASKSFGGSARRYSSPASSPALQLPSHLFALRRRSVTRADPRLLEASLPAPDAALLEGEVEGEI